MKIIYHKRFLSQMAKLQKRQKMAVVDAIDLFSKNPFAPSLYNHALHGDMKKFRALSAGFDIRIIFKEYDGYTVVVMIMVGSHQQVY